MFKYTKLDIPDVILLEPTVYSDNRGLFFESFNQQEFSRIIGHEVSFVQDNHSCSSKGVLRGLHYQLPPKAQGKLVRIVSGEAFDVAVDIRKHSPTFGKWVGEILSAKNKRQLWIPAGFAHGFLALAESTEMLYKVNGYYAQSNEVTLSWDCGEIGINWPLHFLDGLQVSLSEKDQSGISLSQMYKLND